jgi:FtsP/CotA-like multicopper oxidase with cupredoxin domain
MGSTTGRPPASQNNLINGKMNFPCANTTKTCTPNAGISKFFFKSGKKYLLRLINTSSDAMQKFSIDGHKFTVVSQDFVPIKPYSTDLITLGVGQRADVVVEAVGKAKESYWMRSTLGVGPTSCSLADGTSPNAMAAVYYDGADDTAVPVTNTTIALAQITNCANEPLAVTEPLFKISSEPVGTLATQELHINFTNNGTAFVWQVNDVAFRGDYGVALLSEGQKGTLAPKKEWNVLDFGNNGTIRVVMYNHFPFATHPMHLHGKPGSEKTSLVGIY